MDYFSGLRSDSAGSSTHDYDTIGQSNEDEERQVEEQEPVYQGLYSSSNGSGNNLVQRNTAAPSTNASDTSIDMHGGEPSLANNQPQRDPDEFSLNSEGYIK